MSEWTGQLLPEQTVSARNVLNASGYLFQLSVEHRIRAHYEGKPAEGEGSCWVIGREYPWRDDRGQGFIDLMALKSDRIMVVFECKRTQDATWVFVVESSKAVDESAFRLLWVQRDENGEVQSSTKETRGGPETVAAQFCAVRGSGEDHAPMLERLCGTLLRSVEAVALEAFEIGEGTGPLFFLPVIVTNAKLVTFTVDPASISGDGKTDSQAVREVGYLRFHKPLVAEVSSRRALSNFRSALRDRERTVMVVNSEHIVAFLKQLRLYGI